MQTNFTNDQLQDKENSSSEQIIRKCVHCGMCNATCPTYNILGDELDGPRGRIYLIKEMLEKNKPANKKTTKHIDRCLVLLCMYDNLSLGSKLYAFDRSWKKSR